MDGNGSRLRVGCSVRSHTRAGQGWRRTSRCPARPSPAGRASDPRRMPGRPGARGCSPGSRATRPPGTTRPAPGCTPGGTTGRKPWGIESSRLWAELPRGSRCCRDDVAGTSAGGQVGLDGIPGPTLHSGRSAGVRAVVAQEEEREVDPVPVWIGLLVRLDAYGPVGVLVARSYDRVSKSF